MALQPFVGPWPIFQFLNPIQSRWDSFDGGSDRRKAATDTQNNTNTEYKQIDIHASSGIRTHNPSARAGKDVSYLRLRCHCDQRYSSKTKSLFQ
jgi:hypothetical protein